MKVLKGASFAASEAWSGPDVATIDTVAVKLRWADEPYRWHVNTGQEVLVVLDGVVDMHVRKNGVESVIVLERGDVLHVEDGDEHVARPRGPARMLVIEGTQTD